MDTSVIILVVSQLHPIDIFQSITRVNKQFHQLCSNDSGLWRAIKQEDYEIEYGLSQRTYDNCVAFAKEAFQVQKVWDTISKFYTLPIAILKWQPICLTIQSLQNTMDEFAAEQLESIQDESAAKEIAYRVPLELRLFLRKTRGRMAGLQHPDEASNDQGYNGRIPSIEYMMEGFCELGVHAVAQYEEGGDFYMKCNPCKYGYGRICSDEESGDKGFTLRAWLVKTAEEYFSEREGKLEDCDVLIEELKALHKYCGEEKGDEKATQVQSHMASQIDASVLLLVFSLLHPVDIFKSITCVNKQFHQLCSKDSKLWSMITEADYKFEFDIFDWSYEHTVTFAKVAFQVEKVWDTISKFYTLERNTVWIQGKEHVLPTKSIANLQKTMDELAAEEAEWSKNKNKEVAYQVPLELRLFLRKTKGLEAGLQHPDEEGNDSGYNGRIPSISDMMMGFVDASGVHPVARWEEGGDIYMECNQYKFGYGRIGADEDEEDEGTTMRAWLVKRAEEYFRKIEDEREDSEELLEQLKALHKYCDVTDMDDEDDDEESQEEENQQENEQENEQHEQQNTEPEVEKKRSLAESEEQPDTKRSRIESNENTEDQH